MSIKNSRSSILSDDLIASYTATDYLVRAELTAPPLILRIGQYSPQLSYLLTTSQSRYAAYITADNPGSQIMSAEHNQAARIRLRQQLAYYCTQIYSGESRDPTELWPVETGFLTLNIAPHIAATLGQQFGQNAIVLADEAAIPELVLLR